MTLLEIKDLSKDFRGLRALNKLNIYIAQGEILGLIGPNGSGKTTLINIISGFIKPLEGNILYKGKSIVGLKPNQIASKGIIRTFQLTNLFPGLTVIENVMAARHLKPKKNVGIFDSFFRTKGYRRVNLELRQTAMEILAFTGIQESKDTIAKNLPLGDDKKLEIAIALAAEPELLLLDEPAAGMNPEEGAKIIKLIRSIQEMGITTLMIEHNMNVVMELCNRIIVISSGSKVAEGTPEDIAKNETVISIYLGERRQIA